MLIHPRPLLCLAVLLPVLAPQGSAQSVEQTFIAPAPPAARFERFGTNICDLGV